MIVFARTMLLAGALAGASAAEAAPLEAFVGRWQAQDAGLALVEQSMSGDGFSLRIIADNPRRSLHARFVPAGREGVFTTETSGDPLSGETLIWARQADDALIVYHMEIATGGAIVLDRLERRIADGTSSFVLSRRRGAEVEERAGTLERVP